MEKKRTRRRFCAFAGAFLLLLGLSGALTGCGGETALTDVMDEMCGAVKPLPAGVAYVRSCPPDGAEALTDSLLATMFGDGKMPAAMERVEDAVVRSSYTSPFELAVFRCRTADGTDAVVKMCLRRLELLKGYWSRDDSAAFPEDATVRISGRYVIFCVTEDPDAVMRAFHRAL